MFQRLRQPLIVLAATMVVASCGLSPAVRTGSSAGSEAITFASADQLVPVEISYTDRAQLQGVIDAGMDVWGKDRARKVVYGSLTRDQYRVATQQGLKVAKRPVPLSNTFDKGYRTYEVILQDLQSLAAKYPELCELVDVGDSWEKTQGKPGREIWALHLKKAGAGKPAVVYAGCHHARELVTPEMIMNMVHHLLDNYGKDAEATGYVNTRDIWLLPMVNPDGHAIAARGGNQRKNTNNVTGGRSRVGVDLNRNYAASWGTAGDSPNPESDTFRGSKAFSEPETQAVRDLLTKVKPVLYMTYHSFSNAVMWSWDKTTAPPPDKRLEPIGKAMGKLSGYDAYQGCDMYVNSGDDVDWAAEHLGTLAFTIEVGSSQDGFDPPFSRVAKMWSENKPMMLYALKIADNPGAVYGPELRLSQTGSQAAFSAPGALAQAEYFVGAPGPSGSGKPLAVAGKSAQGSFAGVSGRQLVYAHARNSAGAWGPWSLTWSR